MFTFSMFRKYLNITKNYCFENLKKQDNSKTTDEWFQFIIDFLQYEIENYPDEKKVMFKCFKYLNYPENYNEIKDFSSIQDALSEVESTLYLAYHKEENIGRQPFFDIISKNIRITEVQLRFLEKQKRKPSSKEQDLYTFAHYLIFKVRDVDYVSELLKTFSNVVNLKNQENIFLIDVLLDKYLSVLLPCINTYLILYYDKIFNLFLQMSKDEIPLIQQKNILKKLSSTLHELKKSPLSQEKKEKIALFLERSISNIENTYLPSSEEKIDNLYHISNSYPSISLHKPKKCYLDLRDEFVISIDSEKTDLKDDAFSFKRKKNGTYELGIYTPAVADFILLNSSLDKEARRRGKSIYGLDKPIHMFPRELAYKTFSLNCNTDRMVIGCFFEFTPQMELISDTPEIKRCLIRPNYNMTNEQFSKIISREKNRGKKKELYRMLKELVCCLEMEGFKKNISFPTFYGHCLEECLDQAYEKEEIHKIYKSYANYMIYLFKMLTGSKVAQIVNKQGLPFLYHSIPQTIEQSILETLPSDDETINLYLNEFNGTPHYSTESIEHKKLHIPSYCKWTTPIREYMSLVTQRLVIRYFIDQRIFSDKELVSLEKYLKTLCKEINLRNLLNDEYANECRKYYKIKKR